MEAEESIIVIYYYVAKASERERKQEVVKLPPNSFSLTLFHFLNHHKNNFQAG